MKYSIVTPVHNSFKCMGFLFESLKRQKFNNFELVVVDDCSVENEYSALCSALARSELNYKLIQLTENVGAGQARNLGIEAAEGEFIVFLDSDDYLSDDFFVQVEHAINAMDCDLLIFDHLIKEKHKNRHKKGLIYGDGGAIKPEQALKYMNNAPWGKIYKKALIRGKVKFPNLKLAEDWVFNVRYLQSCSTIFYLEKPLYYYVIYPNSLMRSCKNEEYRYEIQAYDLIKRDLKKEFQHLLPILAGREIIYTRVKELLIKGAGNKEIFGETRKLSACYGEWYEEEYCKNLSFHIALIMKAVWHENTILLWILKKVIQND